MMKRLSYLTALLCAMALAGCSNEEAALESNSNKPLANNEVTLTATIGANTRTWADDVTVKWSEGDSFKAYSADGYSYGTFELQSFSNDTHTSASFKCPSMVGEDVSELYYAVYPAEYYDIATKVYTFPTEYTYPNSKAPMFGTIINEKVVFTDLFSGMVRVTLDTQSSGTLKLTGLGISGASTLKSVEGSDTKVLSSDSDQSSTVTLTFTGATVLDIPVPAGDYTTNTISVTLQIDGEVADRTVGTISDNITAKTIKDMGTVQLSALTSATITVDESTTLTSDDLSSYTDLTISGNLDATDLEAIKKWAETNDGETTEKTLDLSGATITNSEELNFALCTALTSVVLPEGTTSLAEKAFCDCTSLTSIENTSSVTYIGAAAFRNCTSLTSIDLSSAIKIGEDAFLSCKSLTSVDLSNVTTIGNHSFRDCTNLESVRNTNNVQSVGSYAFYACSGLSEIDLSSATSIESYAFCGCSGLSKIDLSSATSIGELAFAYCTSLTSVEIPSCVTEIGEFAFGSCSSLTEVTCKADITTNSDNFSSTAFDYIASTAVLYVPNKYLSDYKSLWGSSFSKVEAITTPDVELGGEITGGYSN